MKIQFVPHRERCASIRKTTPLLVFREIMVIYLENHTEHMIILTYILTFLHTLSLHGPLRA